LKDFIVSHDIAKCKCCQIDNLQKALDVISHFCVDYQRTNSRGGPKVVYRGKICASLMFRSLSADSTNVLEMSK
jgi:hypothetical protein